MKSYQKIIAALLAVMLCLTIFVVSLAEEEAGIPIDKQAFDALVAGGPVADDEAIAASAWATKVRETGVLRVGGVRTAALFSQLDEEDGALRGFDAGWYIAVGVIFSLHVSGCVGDLYDAALYLFRFRDPLTLMRDTGPKQSFYLRE